jgi:hypothetical protein
MVFYNLYFSISQQSQQLLLRTIWTVILIYCKQICVQTIRELLCLHVASLILHPTNKIVSQMNQLGPRTGDGWRRNWPVGLIGLSRKSSAPSSMQRLIRLGTFTNDMITTGISLSSDDYCWQNNHRFRVQHWFSSTQLLHFLNRDK